MQREDIVKVLFLLETAYPNSYKSMSNEQKKMQIDFYLEMFGEYEAPIVVVALKNYIKKNQYPPTVAGLTEQITLLTTQDTDSELWNLIAKACRNGYYNSLEEFNKLPKECQLFLGNPASLRELSQIDVGTLNTVTRGQFLKSVAEIRKRENAQQGIPQELKERLNGGLKCLVTEP